MLELNKENFNEEVSASGLTLVDFWNDGCEPCKALMPEVVKLSEEYGDKVKFCKLNTTGARRLAIQQKVLGLPTVILYKDGEKLAEVTKEEATAENIKNMIEQNI